VLLSEIGRNMGLLAVPTGFEPSNLQTTKVFETGIATVMIGEAKYRTAFRPQTMWIGKLDWVDVRVRITPSRRSEMDHPGRHGVIGCCPQ